MAGPYTLHQETDDGSLQPAYFSVASKRAALGYARNHAKDTHPGSDIVRFIVCDGEEMTIATFECRK